MDMTNRLLKLLKSIQSKDQSLFHFLSVEEQRETHNLIRELEKQSEPYIRDDSDSLADWEKG